MLSNPSRTSATRKRSTSSSWKATPKFGRMVGKLQREPSSDASRDVLVHSDRLVGLVLSSTRAVCRGDYSCGGSYPSESVFRDATKRRMVNRRTARFAKLVKSVDNPTMDMATTPRGGGLPSDRFNSPERRTHRT